MTFFIQLTKANGTELHVNPAAISLIEVVGENVIRIYIGKGDLYFEVKESLEQIEELFRGVQELYDARQN